MSLLLTKKLLKSEIMQSDPYTHGRKLNIFLLKIVCENGLFSTTHRKLKERENYVFLWVFRTPHCSRLRCQRAVPNENAQRSLRWMTYTGNVNSPKRVSMESLVSFISYPEAKLTGKSYADVESRVSLCVARRCCEMGRFVKFIFR